MSATAESVTAAKPRKPRGPSKKLRAMLAAAREEGIDVGLNKSAADRWPGAIAALVFAAVAFAAGAWLF